MPIVTVQSSGARSLEEKRAVAKALTQVMVEIYKVPPQNVTIRLEELPEENVAKGGILFSDGGRPR